MSTNDDKILSAVEVQRTPATARDRILLACHGLTWMASQLETVANHMAMVDHDVLRAAATDHRAFLDGIADRLTAAFNDLGDYSNGVDIVTDEDEALLGPVFDLLNEEPKQAGEPGAEVPPFDALWGAGAGHQPDRTSLDMVEEMREDWRD